MDVSGRYYSARSVFVLSIGVGSFDDEAEEELGFVSQRMNEVCRAFEQLGAQVKTSVNQTEGEIEALLRQWLVDDPEPADVTVIHLLGHGRADRSGRLAFVARDNRGVDVDRWIEKAQQEVERGGNLRRVVFLVDTCSAGAATGRQPISELGSGRGVWALGSVISSLPAEQGKFSHWIATALDRLRGHDFTLNEGAIRFTAFVEELVKVGRSESPNWRMSFGFSLEQGDGDWPFLLNPRTAGLTPEQIHARRRSLGYVPGEEELRKDFGARIAAGEEIDDWIYFYDRASGRGLVSADSGTAFFSGRAAELKRYMAWQAGDSPLLTVTGAAGAGKSGLLGVIACAAHPNLRGLFREQWEVADRSLPEVPDVVAVHTRQRSAQQVIDTIAGMARLELPHDDEEDRAVGDRYDADPPAKTDRDTRPWTSELLRTALEHEQKTRLILLDAVDESIEPHAVLTLVADLLSPKDQRGVTTPAPCRILLGGRHEVVDALSGFDELEDVTGDRIDLDTADPGAVEEDVRHYITRLLRTGEPYATGRSSEFVETLAKLGAEGIVRNLRPGSQWGPFLLAGLYVHYLLTHTDPPLSEGVADSYAHRASANLPNLLEAVLITRRDECPALRAVLAVLARSKGNGMPRVTLRRCLKVLYEDDMTAEQFEKTLREASPFLRTGVDRERKTLYRIFQQGLADYLRDHPLSRDPLDDGKSLDLERRLLERLVDPFMTDSSEASSDGWASAEPYVLQHALGHVTAADSAAHAEALLTDPYFLIRFDPNPDHRAIDLCRSTEASEYLRLLSASWRAHGCSRIAADRAAIFAFDADRLGLPEHRARFAAIAKEVAFQPEAAAHSLVWVEGGHIDSSDRYIDTGSSFHASQLAFSPDGALIAASTFDDLRILETETWHEIVPPIRKRVRSMAISPDGGRLAIGTQTWTRNIQFWDIRNRVPVGKPWDSQTGPANSLAISPDGRHLAVASTELDASVWDISTDDPREAIRLPDSENALDAEFSPDGRLLAMVSRSRLKLWKTEGWVPVPLTTEPTSAVTFSARGSLLASLHEDSVVLRSSVTLEEVKRVPLPGETTGPLALSADGTLLAIGIRGSIHVVDVASGSVVNRLVAGRYDIFRIAFHPARESLLLGSSGDGRLRMWRAVTESRVVPELTRFTSSDATASPDGRLIAATCDGSDWLTLRDASRGSEVARIRLDKDDVSPDLHFSPDSRLLVAVGYRGVMHVIRTEPMPTSVPPEAIRLNGQPSRAGSLVFSPDSQRFALGLHEGSSDTYSISVWDSRSLRLIARIPLAESADSVHFAGPDKLFVGINGALAVYDYTGPVSKEPTA